MRWLIVPLMLVTLFGLLMLMVIPIWIAVFFVFWRFVMPWLIVGLVIWAVFALSGRPRHRRWMRYSYPRVPPPVPTSPRPRPEPRPRPDPPQRPELPIDVQVKVEQIRRKVEVLLSYAPRFPPFSQDLYIVRQTANDYLPRTIDAFLALPPDRREVPVDESGKTAREELKEQLDLLDSKLDEIAEDLQRHNLDRLLANRRFLEERFGRGST